MHLHLKYHVTSLKRAGKLVNFGLAGKLNGCLSSSLTDRETTAQHGFLVNHFDIQVKGLFFY